MSILQSLAPSLIVALGSFSAFLLLHVWVWRLPARRGMGYGWLFLLLALIGVVGLTLGPRLVGNAHLSGRAPALAIYLLLAMLYLHFYSGLLRSLSVRILGELADAPDGRLDMAELDHRYGLRQILELRLEALVEGGWIARRGSGYRNRSRGVQWSVWLQRLAHLYRKDVTG